MLLQPDEVELQTGIPANTIRSWCRKFPFLAIPKKGKEMWQIAPSVVGAFRLIRRLREQGYSFDEALRQVAIMWPVAGETESSIIGHAAQEMFLAGLCKHTGIDTDR